MNTSPLIRIEKDLLGTKEVPADRYYGIHTLRALENFNISTLTIGQQTHFIRALAQVKKASARANLAVGRLSEQQSELIQKACDLLIDHPENWEASFPLDVYQGGAGTSINMNTNEVIANIALEMMGHRKGKYDVLHPNDHVNKSQSTNDVYPTALRLATYSVLDELFEKLQHLIASLSQKALEFKTVIKMGRTQLQDAVPMTLGQEFHAFATLLKEDMSLIKQTRELLLEINLGATAIGTGVNTVPGYAKLVTKHLEQVTGLNVKPSADYVEATSDCGVFIIVSSTLKRLAVKLSKISNDLRLLSSGPRAGLNEINLPQMQAGSSIMPAKVNPVIPEVVNQIAFKVIGNDLTITFGAEAGQMQLNAMEPVIAYSTHESIQILTQAIRTLDEKCIQGITANEEVCRDEVMRSVGIVTLLDPLLGHSLCDEIGKQCIAENKTIPEVVLERGLLSKDELDEIFKFENLVSEISIIPDEEVVQVS
ncbi:MULTISPECIES: aspartate ammonia-lyase [Acinetobacter]|uniref:Aspartate ammonia-lyase n=1 Tax=Acinetobacter pollinis TaxID=2605270 RepID=A0ABU6DPU4_9GAMM|nr:MULTISPECIES: aspartate ammonia-lyase [Acinetobacter]MBF7690472.1 aspartate ammonia-lyase [Acinetobacter pollinis]MBF7692532.1 aspartate ammonia-lyase [Acinetobacter pollinis]MBF7697523.1 aspartate ammonia-lyase [Acinetobacter pollinis]MBF7699652.1 aspartate ammonia-lyase [Acinetobacter pollinis]MEB5475889.1 aspartate ammonia-lyase [Acinetobacter pollinis]